MEEKNPSKIEGDSTGKSDPNTRVAEELLKMEMEQKMIEKKKSLINKSAILIEALTEISRPGPFHFYRVHSSSRIGIASL